MYCIFIWIYQIYEIFYKLSITVWYCAAIAIHLLRNERIKFIMLEPLGNRQSVLVSVANKYFIYNFGYLWLLTNGLGLFISINITELYRKEITRTLRFGLRLLLYTPHVFMFILQYHHLSDVSFVKNQNLISLGNTYRVRDCFYFPLYHAVAQMLVSGYRNCSYRYTGTA